MKRVFSTLLCLLGTVFAEGEETEKEKKQTTQSGLEYWVLKAGKAGTRPLPGDSVLVHYAGWLDDGRKFDSSHGRGKPYEFMVGVGQVIQGWDEGVQLMGEGAKFKLRIPAQLAYGAQRKGVIPPNSTLNFEVSLLKVIRGERIPKFRGLDEEKLKTTPSGLRFEVVKRGEGENARPGQCVKFKFVLWNDKGKLVMCTQASNFYISGYRESCNLPRVPEQFRPKFLNEAIDMMKPGGVVRFEVTPALCWGALPFGTALPANSLTFWQLELVKVYDPPKFVKTPADRLTKTKSGLAYKILRTGTGAKPGPRDRVTVLYTGWTPDGKMFDSAHVRDGPISFSLNRVIKGWTEGLQLMKEGAIYRFTIPGKLAYGDKPKRQGAPAGTLIFLVELLKVEK